MMLTFLMITIMAALVVIASGLAIQDWKRDLSRSRVGEPEKPAGSTTPPESLEGVLVRQILDHEISARQYRTAMHRLAERDVDRHPLPDLPGDAPPG